MADIPTSQDTAKKIIKEREKMSKNVEKPIPATGTTPAKPTSN